MPVFNDLFVCLLLCYIEIFEQNKDEQMNE